MFVFSGWLGINLSTARRNVVQDSPSTPTSLQRNPLTVLSIDSIFDPANRSFDALLDQTLSTRPHVDGHNIGTYPSSLGRYSDFVILRSVIQTCEKDTPSPPKARAMLLFYHQA